MTAPSKYSAATTRCPKCRAPLRVLRYPFCIEAHDCGAKVVSTPVAKVRAGQDAEDGLARQFAIHNYRVSTFRQWINQISGGDAIVRQFPWGLMLDPARGFKADFFHVGTRTLIEVDGDAHRIKARHRETVRRVQLATAIELRVVTVLPEQVRDGTAIEVIRAALGGREGVVS